MTCKDCVCYEACEHFCDEITTMRQYEDMKTYCRHFKNKFDYAEVKHGEWKIITKFNAIGDIPYYICECSECGFRRNFFAEDEENERPNYCEVCGAKMDGRSDT